MHPGAQSRPAGLCIRTLCSMSESSPSSSANQEGEWYGCAAASPVHSTSKPATAHDTLRVHTRLRPSTAAAAEGGCGPTSPHGRSSTCSSPKTPQQAAAAQLKGLQRTPLPLILARMKVLLDRLNMLMEEGACPSAACTPTTMPAARPAAPAAGQPAQAFFASDKAESSTSSSSANGLGATGLGTGSRGQPSSQAPHTHHGWHHSSNAAAFSEPADTASPSAATKSTTHSKPHAAGGPSSPVGSGRDAAGAARGGKKQAGSRKPTRGLIEVSTSGGLSKSVMQSSPQSILEELEVTLGFISDFLATLTPDTRKALATVARLESYKKDQLIYDIGDTPTHFFVILSGRIDIWSHPPGTHKPQSTVSVLRRGDAFGDQAIINGEPHGTAASPATNATLLVVTRQDFLSVLGSHFHDVATTWQNFLVTHVGPLAESEPGVVRRLCSTLVVDKPTDGQECSVHEDQVCFIQAGMFELRLVDLAAQHAAEAALAAAIASASSALTLTPIPPHLRLGAGAKHSSSRPVSAPAASARPAPAAAGAASTDAAAAGGALDGAAGAGGRSGSNTGSGGSAGGLAAGLSMLQSSLADLPTLGSEGVLASVRVKDGRLVGTQGLARELRKQHGTRVPYKVLAELGPGSWFGGGEAIYGAGPLQSALRVVAVGPGCQVVHAHLSGLEKHGGPGLIKRLRDDAAFKLTYYLGRLGVLPLGAAVGHPGSTLVAEAAAAAAAAEPQSPDGVAGTAAKGTFGAAGGHSTASSAPSQGRGTNRSRPASAAAAAATSKGCRAQLGSSQQCCPSAAPSRPASAARAPHKRANSTAAAAAAIRRSSSCGSAVSSTWDAMQIGSLPPTADEAATATALYSSTALTSGTAGSTAGSSVLFKASKPRQKRAHVPGSGVFGPGVMAALQHVRSLQAPQQLALPDTAAASRDAACNHHPAHTNQLPAGQAGQRSAVEGGQDFAPAACAATTSSPSSRPSSAPRSSICIPAAGAAAPTTAASSSCLGGGQAVISGGSAAQGFEPGSRRYQRRPASAGCGSRSGTAADAYWQHPEHCSSATGVALSGLLSSLFTDGLQPLVSELDTLISRTGYQTQQTLLQKLPHQQQHLQAGSIQQLQQQRLSCITPKGQQQQQQQQYLSVLPQQQDATEQQPGALQHCQWQRNDLLSRPASAAARLQRPTGLYRPGSAKMQPKGGMPSQQSVEHKALEHRPSASLLAASVMWQRSSEAAFRPPLRQCLTTAEIQQQCSVIAGSGESL